jgi:hypothetical protein
MSASPGQWTEARRNAVLDEQRCRDHADGGEGFSIREIAMSIREASQAYKDIESCLRGCLTVAVRIGSA